MRIAIGTAARVSAVARDLGALVAIACVVAWQHWRPLFEPGTWLPAHGGDLAGLIYPNYRFAAWAIRQGEIPFWNPYSLTGAPFLADIQSGVLYPLNLLVFALVPEVGYRVLTGLVLFHLWLAGANAYACGRGLGQTRLGALFAGIAFALSDLFVIHVGNLNTIAVASWLPLIVLATLKVLGGARRWIAIGGLAVAMAALAGHVQPLLFGLLAAAVVTLIRAAMIGRRDWWAAARRLVGVAAMVAIGLAIAAPQLLPARELTAYSLRSALTYEQSIEYSLAPAHLISMIVPGWYGRGPDRYWGQWLRSEGGYIGIATLALAALALTIAAARHRRLTGTEALAASVVAPIGGLGLVGFALALGGATGLHALFYQFVPLFGSLRGAARTIVLTDLALALLAGAAVSAISVGLRCADCLAIDRFLARATRLWLYALALVPFGGVLLLLLRDNPALPRATGVVEGWIVTSIWFGATIGVLRARQRGVGRRHGAAIAFGALIALDLVSASQGIEITHRDPRQGFGRPEIASFVQERDPFARVDTNTGISAQWPPSSALILRLGDVATGNHPLELADFHRYWSAIESRSSVLYDQLGARYLVAPRSAPVDQSKFSPVLESGGDLTVYENSRAVGAARLIGRTESTTHDRVIERMRQIDLTRTAIVEGPDTNADGFADLRVGRIGTGAMRITLPSNHSGGYVVVAESWYPGWRATVDGRPADVVRSNFLFLGVRVGPEDRQVELRFIPTDWAWSIALATVGVVGAIVAAAWPFTLGLWTAHTRTGRGSASES
ncbi:MAG: hypothetical protein EPO26_00555 [Chloroflexota bacterium]|nr:MAG: hypothetical protein EPO26_00555 [Chloroflexota bacterium]